MFNTMEEQTIFLEQVKTISNLCAIAEVLVSVERKELLPTALELMFIEIQNINDDYCVARHGTN